MKVEFVVRLSGDDFDGISKGDLLRLENEIEQALAWDFGIEANVEIVLPSMKIDQ